MYSPSGRSLSALRPTSRFGPSSSVSRAACFLVLLALAPGCDSGEEEGEDGDVQTATFRATVIPSGGASGALYEGNYAFADRNGVQTTGDIGPGADGSWSAQMEAIGITMSVEVDADALGPVRTIITVDGNEAETVTVNPGGREVIQYFNY
jgi:hypothetical protein